MPDFGFKDRNYIVTGGAGSIGRAVVEIIVSCGGNVTAVDLDGATLRELGSVLPEGRYRYKTADLSSPEEIRSVFAEITEYYGQIHGLVNCVGVLCTTPITEVTQEEWDRVIAINLTGVFAAIQSVLPNMLSNHCGSIVNVSSVAGKLGGGLLGTSAYATSKGGLNALTKVVAKTCGPQGVRC
ncbi:MAG: SDR family oxidoreductase, partial [Oscillospiraceae bacterium]|nr:SDR family oxidoreductase [Oscillospiraceae bacterium]